jgi:hypothetical protein
MSEKIYGKINVQIKGITALLMNRLNPESLRPKSRQTLTEYNDKDKAEASAYIATIGGERQLYVPSYAVYSMIIQTAGQYKSRRTSIRGILAGTIRIEPEFIPLGHCNYDIDVRPVMIQHSRVLHARAKIPQWQIDFQIIYNRKILTGEVVQTIKTILEDAGTRVGLLDYRPQHKGWFGTFEVTKFEVES